jgi:hypothetical protein
MGEESRKRRDERTVGRAKPRSPLLTSQNRELMPKEQQFHILGELGPTATDEQPQNCGKGKVGKGEEHRAILPRPANWFGSIVPCAVQTFLVFRARVNLERRGKEPSRALHSLRPSGCARRGREHTPRVRDQTPIGVLTPFTLPRAQERSHEPGANPSRWKALRRPLSPGALPQLRASRGWRHHCEALGVTSWNSALFGRLRVPVRG